MVATAVFIHLLLTPLLFAAVVLFFERGYESQFINNVRSVSQLAAAQFSEKDLSTREGTEERLDELLYSGQLEYAELVLSSGEIIHSPSFLWLDYKFKEDFYFAHHGDDLYFIATPLFQIAGNDPPVILRMGFDESQVQEKIEMAYVRGLLVVLAYLFITLLLILLSAPRLTKPLIELRDAARKIASGNDDETLNVTSRINEFASLATDLELMRKGLVGQRKKIVERESYTRAVVENMAEAMVVLDDKHQIISFNSAAEKLFGYRDHEIRGRDFTAIIAENIRETVNPRIEAMLGMTSNDIYQSDDFEWVGLRENGSTFSLAITVGEMKLEGRRQLICNMHNITDRKLAENAMLIAHHETQEASRAKSEFLSNMSHELRTPLNAIIGYSELLLEVETERGDEESSQDLRNVLKASNHLMSLINNVLDLSKIEAGHIELYIEEFNITTMITDVVATVTPIMDAQRNTFHVEIADDVGKIKADIMRTRQIVLNLLSNAAKFSEEGTVNLHVKHKIISGKSWIVFTVKDTGIGISPEQQKKLFNDFIQADSSVTRRYGGTGLGLAISRRFSSMMGGEIRVESTLGEGSSFILQLPLTQDKPSRLLAAK